MREPTVREDPVETAKERILVEGLIDGDTVCAVELLVRIRPLMRHFLLRHHATLRDWHEEILHASELRLFEWQAADPCLLRVNESLADLAQRAVHEEARREARYRSANRRAAAEREQRELADPEDNADMATRQREISDVLRSLPDEATAILWTHCEHEVGDGRSLEVVLGITPEAARKRLQRARAVFFQALLAHGLADNVKEPS